MVCRRAGKETASKKLIHVIAPGDKKPFAVRVIEDHFAVEPIIVGSDIVPLPELGGMGFNFQLYDGCLVTVCVLPLTL